MLTANSMFNIDNFDVPIYDTQGKLATMHYQVGTIDERTRLFYASIPIMFGYHNCGFYIGAGAKIGLPIVPTVKSQYTYTTTATYSEYIEDFVNMPNHYNATYTSECKDNLTPSLKLSAIVLLSPSRAAKAEESFCVSTVLPFKSSKELILESALTTTSCLLSRYGSVQV